MSFPRIHLDESQAVITCGERRAQLTKQQAEIFGVLARRRGLVSYEDLTRAIDPGARLANARTQITTQVSKVRTLLADAGIPLSILTVRDRGYYLEPSVELVSSEAGQRRRQRKRR